MANQEQPPIATMKSSQTAITEPKDGTAMKERAMKISDEGLGDEDEPRTVGEAESRWGREKKMRRKKEERREAGERNIEKERKRKYFLNERRERNLLKYYYYF